MRSQAVAFEPGAVTLLGGRLCAAALGVVGGAGGGAERIHGVESLQELAADVEQRGLARAMSIRGRSRDRDWIVAAAAPATPASNSGLCRSIAAERRDKNQGGNGEDAGPDTDVRAANATAAAARCPFAVSTHSPIPRVEPARVRHLVTPKGIVAITNGGSTVTGRFHTTIFHAVPVRSHAEHGGGRVRAAFRPSM